MELPLRHPEPHGVVLSVNCSRAVDVWIIPEGDAELFVSKLTVWVVRFYVGSGDWGSARSPLGWIGDRWVKMQSRVKCSSSPRRRGVPSLSPCGGGGRHFLNTTLEV
eukprot:1149976-Pelagomonas_calceolata.AAC.2